MAHEIHRDASGKAHFAYVGSTPWHGLGQLLTPDASLAVWTQEAGFNWQIERGDVMTELADGSKIVMPERNLLYRSDTKVPLAVVGSKYKIVQPTEILHFYEDLIGAAGFTLETAGMLFGGRRFFAMARTNYSDEVLAGDKVDQFLLLTTACDGSLATTAKFTSVRVVCNNTLTMSLHHDSKQNTVKVPHSASFDPKKVKETLGIAGETFDNFLVDMRKLAETPMSKNEAINFLIELVGDPMESLEDQTPGAANLMTHLFNLWNTDSIGNELAGHTHWGMLNAVTEFYDHHTGHKTRDAALNNTWFGEGEKLKLQAYDMLVAD
jgi:phage/plasmid-like protein (TIGR03299 family)